MRQTPPAPWSARFCPRWPSFQLSASPALLGSRPRSAHWLASSHCSSIARTPTIPSTSMEIDREGELRPTQGLGALRRRDRIGARLRDLLVERIVAVFSTRVFAFATTLATYLAGLAVGSALYCRFKARVRDPWAIFGLLHRLRGARRAARRRRPGTVAELSPKPPRNLPSRRSPAAISPACAPASRSPPWFWCFRPRCCSAPLSRRR